MQKVQKLLHSHAKSYTIILVVVIIIIISPADVISTYSDSGEEAELLYVQQSKYIIHLHCI